MMYDDKPRVHCSQVAATSSLTGDDIRVDLSLIDALGEEWTLAFDGDEALEIATQILATIGEVIVHQQRASQTLN